jgi:class 3 adenylate cyclase
LLEIVSSKLAESTAERGLHYANENKLIAAFSSHLSPSLTARLIASGEDFGKPRDITGTVLFADIRGFTDKSAAMQPANLAKDLGSYLERMVSILHRYGAFVDKFIGDAVMAVWGLPDHDTHDASTAFDCAMEMIRESSTLEFGGSPIAIGVGIAQGRIFCGNVGSELKRQFTVLGNAVNLAARCESLCKDLNANLVISDEIEKQLREDQRSGGISNPQHFVKGFGPLDLHSFSARRADLVTS